MQDIPLIDISACRAGVHGGDVFREVWRTNWPDVLPATDEFELAILSDQP
jgi:hypothetical protein